MERAFNRIICVTSKYPIMPHHKSSIWCLSKSMLKGCLPLIQVLRGLCLIYWNRKKKTTYNITNHKLIDPNRGIRVIRQLFERKKRGLNKMYDKLCTLRVNARPSRPSGNKTVSNFLSSLTTTLHVGRDQLYSRGIQETATDKEVIYITFPNYSNQCHPK